MNIDTVIKDMQQLKDNGHQHIIVGWWTKEFVEELNEETITDEQWVHISDSIEAEIDWSCINEQIQLE